MLISVECQSGGGQNPLRRIDGVHSCISADGPSVLVKLLQERGELDVTRPTAGTSSASVKSERETPSVGFPATACGFPVATHRRKVFVITLQSVCMLFVGLLIV